MRKTRRKFLKYLLFIGGIVLLAAAVIILLLERQSATLDQKIAQFEAKRKIPDSENAAVIYEKLFTNFDKNQLVPQFMRFYHPEPNYWSKPWLSKEHPEAAEWLKNQQETITELFKASEFEKCNLPVCWNPLDANLQIKSTNIHKMFRDWSKMLTIAANNDIAEGRLDDAIEKARCIYKMSEHIYQQPLYLDFLMATGNEGLSLHILKNIIIESQINEQQLNRIEEFPIQTQDTSKNQLAKLQEAEKLHEEKQKTNLTYFQRIQMYYFLLRSGISSSIDTKQLHEIYLRNLMSRRANRIFIGLKRYKNQNGRWPESLEQIKSFIDPNAFIDPLNGGAFVYKKTDNSFTLYSRGPNNIDEGNSEYDIYLSDEHGQISSDITDDLMIWPSN